MQEHSGVTVSMLAFHAGGQGSNPTIDKFFSWTNGTYFHKIVSCKSCITFIFSYINLYEYSGVMVSIVAFQAGGQGSITSSTFFFILNGHFFFAIYNFIFQILFLNDMIILCVNMLVMTWTIKIYGLNS